MSQKPSPLNLLGQMMVLTELTAAVDRYRPTLGLSERFECAVREYIRTEAVATGSALSAASVNNDNVPEELRTSVIDLVTKLIDDPGTCTCGMHPERMESFQ